MDVDGVADAHADERPGHLAVERPVAEGRALGQPALDFDAEQIDAHGLRLALADRRRQVGRFARDVGLDHRLRRRPRRDDELPLHARELVAGHAAEIDEVAGLGGAEGDRRAGAFSGDARRLGVLIGKHDVVLGALAIDRA